MPAQAERIAAKRVQAWSSPLFSHVEINVDDDRVIPRWANALFTAGVVVVFGFAGRYAWMNETRKSDRKRMEREEREERARVAIEAGALRDHRQKNFAVSNEVDPFEGMSPEEIERLSAANEAEAGGAGR